MIYKYHWRKVMETRRVELIPTDLPDSLNVNRLYCIYSYYYTPKFAFLGESHEPWELVYVQSGRVVVETSDYTQTLNGGMALLHKPWDFHKIRADNISCYVNIISFTVFQNELLLPVADKPLTLDKTEQSYILNIINDGTTIVAGKNHVPEMKKWQTKKFAAHQAVKNLLELLLIRLIRHNLDEKEPDINEVSKMNSAVLSVINILSDNLCEKLCLNKIAQKVGYSVSRISAIFKEFTGESIINYFIKMRIQKAQELIVSNNMTFQEISDYLAFDTIQYFCSQFKKTTGFTPLQYKKLVQVSDTYCDTNFNKS